VRPTQVRIRTATTTRRARCSRNESLVSASHAVGFYGERPPSAALMRAVSATQRVRNGVVTLTVHASAAAGGSSAVVQLDLVCTSR
jgi:hypothetical protein